MERDPRVASSRWSRPGNLIDLSRLERVSFLLLLHFAALVRDLLPPRSLELLPDRVLRPPSPTESVSLADILVSDPDFGFGGRPRPLFRVA